MYNLNLENFNGPFDLLLKLLDEKKMDIRDVSLAAVTDQFIETVRARKQIGIGDLASFLSIAARLLYLKSKAVLPSLEILSEEEEDAEALKERLERYKEVREMAKKLSQIIKNSGEMFSRFESKNKAAGFYPPENLTRTELDEIFFRVMGEYEAEFSEQVLPEESIQEIVSLEEKLLNLQNLISRKEKSSFNKFVEGCPRIEIIVSFLALLELIKQDVAIVYQKREFGEIEILSSVD